MNINKQKGFTLVEIAIVLVIIGLLLGGILKGQELISSARVRNLADQNSGIQAAYYGFIDRYRAVPGDMTAAAAIPAFGVTVNTGGDGTGQLDNDLTEATALWEQLSRSNFIGGGFSPATSVPLDETEYAFVAPTNAFGGSLILSQNTGYTGANGQRLNLHMGLNVPVNIARELDMKVDDGLPNTGVVRLTEPDTTDTDFDTANFKTNFADCTAEAGVTVPGGAAGDGTDITDIYDLFDDDGDCGQVFVY